MFTAAVFGAVLTDKSPHFSLNAPCMVNDGSKAVKRSCESFARAESISPVRASIMAAFFAFEAVKIVFI